MSPDPAQVWVEIAVEAEPEAVDDVTALLNRHCVGGAVIEERPPETATLPSRRVRVKGYLPEWDEATRQRLELTLLLLSRTGSFSSPEVRVLAPEDWADAWKAFFPVQHIGRRTVVAASWHDYTPQEGEVVLRIDPGMAFGTGLHATTRLCLEALEDLTQPGMRVLDLGTGSGILAIAAALQGASRVMALDVDAVAVRVARQNAAHNGVGSLVHADVGTLGRGPEGVPTHTGGDYDLVLVNILAETIAALAPHLARAVSQRGLCVASGILVEKAPQVTRALAAAGLMVREEHTQESWAALVAGRE